MSPRATLIVFVKEPQPGRVKTRLARDIGRVGAAWWFRHQSMRLIRRLSADHRWRLLLAVSPDTAGMASRVWPAGIPRLPQGRGDLGRRMLGALAAPGPGPVAVIGSDIPGIDASAVARAFEALRGGDAVLGPAPDGGFWLIGRAAGQRLPLRLLDGVAWSTERAMAETEARLTRAGRRVVHAQTLADVDTLSDLRRLGLPAPTPGG
ncbi:MAG: TIGR04282 family arsenosugar biosynthesis glycosyltransferase [Pseudomonadota bacterium]